MKEGREKNIKNMKRKQRGKRRESTDKARYKATEYNI
jgi:hypothetical protein